MHNEKKILEVAALLKNAAQRQRVTGESLAAANEAGKIARAEYDAACNAVFNLEGALAGVVKGEIWDIFKGKWVQCDANGKPIEEAGKTEAKAADR